MIDKKLIQQHLEAIQSTKGWKATLRSGIFGQYIELLPNDTTWPGFNAITQLNAWAEIVGEAQQLLDEVERLNSKMGGLVQALEILSVKDADWKYEDADAEEIAERALREYRSA